MDGAQRRPKKGLTSRAGMDGVGELEAVELSSVAVGLRAGRVSFQLQQTMECSRRLLHSLQPKLCLHSATRDQSTVLRWKGKNLSEEEKSTRVGLRRRTSGAQGGQSALQLTQPHLTPSIDLRPRPATGYTWRLFFFPLD